MLASEIPLIDRRTVYDTDRLRPQHNVIVTEYNRGFSFRPRRISSFTIQRVGMDFVTFNLSIDMFRVDSL